MGIAAFHMELKALNAIPVEKNHKNKGIMRAYKALKRTNAITREVPYDKPSEDHRR